MGSTKVTDEKLNQVLERHSPITLPAQAYGPQKVEWTKTPPMVRAWIQWPHKAAERVQGVALGWNDRIVVVRWNTAGGDVECVVWRNAVSRKTNTPP